VLVSQLRDEIDLLWGKGTADHLTTVHPLQAFSRSYFAEGSGLHTYAKEWRAAQSTFSTGAVCEREGSSVDLLPPQESAQGLPVITLSQLARFLRKPVGAFFRERLQVHLEDERSQLHDEELFGLAGLDLYQLIDHELQHVPTELSADTLPEHVQQVVQRLRQAGALPLAGVGRLTAEHLKARLQAMLGAALRERQAYLNAAERGKGLFHQGGGGGSGENAHLCK
jgi:exodeoxyribonuclease V gamma subunit